jgi:hypothetical protein
MEPPANNSEGCLGLFLLLFVLGIAYQVLLFLVNLFSGNFVWQQSPAQKKELCASAPDRIARLYAQKRGSSNAVREAPTATAAVDILKSDNDIDEQIEAIEASVKALGCSSIRGEIEFVKNGQNACVKHLTSLANYRAEPNQKYEINGNTIFRVWFVKEKSNPVFSLAECRRDSSSNASVLQYREVLAKGKGSPTPVTDWSVGDQRIFYDNSDPKCIGLTIAQCEKIERVVQSSTRFDPCEVAKARLDQTQRDFDRWGTENAAAYAAGVSRAQLPPAPRVVDAMQAVQSACP